MSPHWCAAAASRRFTTLEMDSKATAAVSGGAPTPGVPPPPPPLPAPSAAQPPPPVLHRHRTLSPKAGSRGAAEGDGSKPRALELSMPSLAAARLEESQPPAMVGPVCIIPGRTAEDDTNSDEPQVRRPKHRRAYSESVLELPAMLQRFDKAFTTR